MGAHAGRKIITDGLLFSYDHDDSSSFVGAPTTNYGYINNARIDDSYATYTDYTADTTWLANHDDSIRVYNDAGTQITGYVNTGANGGNWELSQHAIWTYDDILKRPVVTMRDWDSQWKAKSWAIGYSMTDMGIASTDQYTISWLQWTGDITKSVNAGLYGHNDVAANGFHDGLSNSVAPTTSFNTKSHTWQRVYATFTAVSNWDFTRNLNCYMYGYYGTDNTVKLTDVQIEPNAYATGFSKELTRTNTEAIIDTAGGNTITATSLTYDDYSFSFNGTSDMMTFPALGVLTNFTVGAWFKPSSHPSTSACVVSELYPTTVNFKLGYTGAAGVMQGGFYNGAWRYSPTMTTTIGEWHYGVVTYDGANLTIYKNGISGGQTAETSTPTSGDQGYRIGRRWDAAEYFPGDIHTVQIYDRALTASEVHSNFIAMRGRFGI